MATTDLGALDSRAETDTDASVRGNLGVLLSVNGGSTPRAEPLSCSIGGLPVSRMALGHAGFRGAR